MEFVNAQLPRISGLKDLGGGACQVRKKAVQVRARTKLAFSAGEGKRAEIVTLPLFPTQLPFLFAFSAPTLVLFEIFEYFGDISSSTCSFETDVFAFSEVLYIYIQRK